MLHKVFIKMPYSIYMRINEEKCVDITSKTQLNVEKVSEVYFASGCSLFKTLEVISEDNEGFSLLDIANVIRTEESQDILGILTKVNRTGRKPTKSYVKDKLVEIVDNTTKTDDDMLEFNPNTAVKALSELSKLEGHYAPTQIKVQSELDVTFSYNIDALRPPKIINPASKMSGSGHDENILDYIPANIEFERVTL